jgi:hypothetical protein
LSRFTTIVAWIVDQKTKNSQLCNQLHPRIKRNKMAQNNTTNSRRHGRGRNNNSGSGRRNSRRDRDRERRSVQNAFAAASFAPTNPPTHHPGPPGLRTLPPAAAARILQAIAPATLAESVPQDNVSNNEDDDDASLASLEELADKPAPPPQIDGEQ